MEGLRSAQLDKPPSCLAGRGTMIHFTAQVPVLVGARVEELWAKRRCRL
jgi:hypothetical protein